MKFPLFLLAIALFGCKSDPKTTTAPAPVETKPAPAPVTPPPSNDVCFLFAEKKDSTSIRLHIEGDVVTGDMWWNPYEKDGAYGKLKGKKVGNTITADYNFTIEGSQQSEEMIFVLAGDKLIEKSGPLVEGKDGKMVMKDPANAKDGTILSKVDCTKLRFPN